MIPSSIIGSLHICTPVHDFDCARSKRFHRPFARINCCCTIGDDGTDGGTANIRLDIVFVVVVGVIFVVGIVWLDVAATFIVEVDGRIADLSVGRWEDILVF